MENLSSTDTPIPNIQPNRPQNTAVGLERGPASPVDVAPMKIMVLHAFRQSGASFSAKTKRLNNALADFAELVYIDAPFLCERPEALDEPIGPNHQRCWWNASDDLLEYRGWERSFEVLDRQRALQGPFDGVIGFCQGAALAGLWLAARAPAELRFAICISGYASRDSAHAGWICPGAVSAPSLHIYGETDPIIEPARARALAACFEAPRIVSHPGGHFVPAFWPNEQIRSFALSRALPASKARLKDRVRMARRRREPVALSSQGQALHRELSDGVEVGSAVEQHLGEAQDRSALLEDLQVIMWASARKHDYCKMERIDDRVPGDLFHEIFLAGAALAPMVFLPLVDKVPKSAGAEVEGWRLLSRLAVLSGQGSDVFKRVVAAFEARLKEDRARTTEVPSGCALAAPRTRSATNRACRLAEVLAGRLFPQLEKVEAYIAYTRLISGLSHRFRRAHPDPSALVMERRARTFAWTTEQLQAQVSEDVLSPKPVPMRICSPEQLTPLVQHLHKREAVHQPETFSRGTHTPDGRLDLCKQVVGPSGIRPLLGSLQEHPHVSRLLLGNNLVGNKGAEAIARFVRSGRSRIKVWYIAGNRIDAEGAREVCAAVGADPQVRGLWLKRNPLGPKGAREVARMLRTNDSLQTLDLVNTGILDEGAAAVLEALHDNETIRHLYIGTNGLTEVTAERIARYLVRVDRLESLFVSCNRFHDAGVAILAEGLARSRRLRRLGLASNRIGPSGAKALTSALEGHASLRFLDLGWTRATAAVGELGNQIGDVGTAHLVSMLSTPSALRAMDLSHNGISKKALDRLCAALPSSKLVYLQMPQYRAGARVFPRIEAALRRNWEKVQGQPGEADTIDDYHTPAPARGVLSVYRTA